MNDDGTIARLPDLVAFAQLHGLKIGCSLIAIVGAMTIWCACAP
jgi:3,4-dihydroxy-2-butanone 4-phosphate synthase